MTERQLHIRAYRTARGAGLNTDRANAVAHKVVERCITNTPWPHDDNVRTDPAVVDRITRRISLAEPREPQLPGPRLLQCVDLLEVVVAVPRVLVEELVEGQPSVIGVRGTSRPVLR